ncbi:MAG: hypothetical protein V3T48_09730 [Vicinamibacterales bacterium]
MSNKVDLYQPEYEPPPVVLFERRRNPDRRTTWRGGRRDSDWLNRPPGALAKLDRSQRGRWRRWFSTT